MKENLLYYSLKYNGNWEKIYKAIYEDEKTTDTKILDKVKNLKSDYITIADSDYPEIFKKMTRPPFVLYYSGDKTLLDNEEIYGVYFNKVVSTESYKIIRNYFTKRFSTSTKIVLLNKKNVRELMKIRKEFLSDNLILINPYGTKELKDNELLNVIEKTGKKTLIISEAPTLVDKLDESIRENSKYLASLSKELFLPNVFKDGESYSLLCHAIDEDTKLSTIKTDESNTIANNFLISQGAKNIKRGQS